MMRKLIKTFTAITIISTLLIGAAANAATTSFKDVKSGAWYEGTIKWAVDKGIVNGYTDGTFKPSANVSEEEFLSMLIRAYKPDLVAKKGDPYWSYQYYQLAEIANYPVSKDRKAKINRTSVAELVVGTQGKNFVGNDAIQYMLAKGLAQGKTDFSISGYKGSDYLTRAEAVTFIKNVADNASMTLQTRPLEPSTDLPALPKEPVENTGIEAIDDMNNTTAKAWAEKVRKAVDSSYGVYYNGNNTTVGIKNQAGDMIFSYGDSRITRGAEGTVIINMANLLDKNTDKPIEAHIKQIVAAMKALGFPADDKMATAIKDTVGAKVDEANFKLSDGTSWSVFSVANKYGVILMYLD